MLPSRFERTDIANNELLNYQTFNDTDTKSTQSNPRVGPADYNIEHVIGK